MYSIRTPLVLVATVSALASGSHTTAADPLPPPAGTVLTVPVLSVSLNVGSMGRETKHLVYAPPPGWYVRSHQVITSNRYGSTSYAVSTIPAKWDWRTDEQTTSLDHANAGVTLSVYKVPEGAQGARSQDTVTRNHQTQTSSHHLLVLDATARGCGLFQSGSGIELTVVAELVYLGR